MEEKSFFRTLVMFQIYSEYADGATHALFNMTREEVERIIRLSNVVKENEVCEIGDYFCSYDLLDTDYDNEKSPLNLYSDDGEPLIEATEFRSECGKIKIREHDFYCTCLVKHSDPAIHCETDPITIATLKQVLEIADAKFEDLGTYVGRNDLSEIAEQFLKERMNES